MSAYTLTVPFVPFGIEARRTIAFVADGSVNSTYSPFESSNTAERPEASPA